MERKIRVGAVSYLNTKPLIYGFEQGMMKDEMELVFDYPAKIASALLKDEIDIGLVPVAILPEMKEFHIVSDYGIACDGEVASVCLFSEVPLEEIKTVLLDYQSRTSVVLAKVLMQEYWKIAPEIINTNTDFSSQIKDTTAAVIIGDRALERRQASKYVYDLGEAWKQYTGLPFVFAAWVSNKPIPLEFIDHFNEANRRGLNDIEKIVQQNPFAAYDLAKYYTVNIKFQLNNSMREAVDLFLNKLKALQNQATTSEVLFK
ncbi:menaquinone biosynthetic enzyme MqnA/MqnD family protein [Ferruginibacter albus]|uniref:menaquinone biosynthetic enzyme MqnA/MqnD family protein n=1 Tax=Ferruginibacter albus TaxID=2875540 RepID=UPI001CC4EF3A|nr:menaquinone biosynthesis protein [Ferruginibacter albus]UAY53114.1 menaquinone biosynthesis protein [Ferruginibacter albus]